MRTADFRIVTVSGLAAACLTLSACLPAAPPPAATPPSPPASPTLAPTTSTNCGSLLSSSSVGLSADQATTNDDAADAGITASTARAQAKSANRQAVADSTIPGTAGDVPLVVTTVNQDGHPDIRTLSTTSATNAGNQAAAVTRDVTNDGGQVLAVEPEHTMTAAVIATDPGRGSQWALNTLDYEHVWDTTTGGGECVAVLDTGIDLSHPDLAGRVAATDDATSPPQGIDDGYGHGTHVAGIIAADADNGAGIAGAAPGVQLLAVKVLGNDGVGNSSWTSAGIIWAVDHGATVINMSLGASCPQSAPAGCDTLSMRTAMAYAQNHDVVVVAAGGNDGDPNNPAANPHLNYWSWPAVYDWSIAVAATTSSNGHAVYSTQASYIDVAAPGTGILSTIPPDSVIGRMVSGASYVSLDGTSMASPYVAAEAALLRAAHPTETADQIRARIVGHVSDLGAPGADSTFGAGLINPGAALAG